MLRDESSMLHTLPTIHDEFILDALVDVEEEDDSLFHVDGTCLRLITRRRHRYHHHYHYYPYRYHYPYHHQHRV